MWWAFNVVSVLSVVVVRRGGRLARRWQSMGSVGTGSADAGSANADSINAGRERLARYSLTGPENQAAVNAGLAGGAWFRSAVPRKRMKELMKRSDYPAVRDTAIWLGLILLFGA